MCGSKGRTSHNSVHFRTISSTRVYSFLMKNQWNDFGIEFFVVFYTCCVRCSLKNELTWIIIAACNYVFIYIWHWFVSLSPSMDGDEILCWHWRRKKKWLWWIISILRILPSIEKSVVNNDDGRMEKERKKNPNSNPTDDDDDANIYLLNKNWSCWDD